MKFLKMKALAVLIGALAARSLDAVKLEVFSPAPAVAASPGPAVPGLEALHITFEIKNFNYYDLTKETCPKKVKFAKAKKGKSSVAKKGKVTKKGPGDPLEQLDKAFKPIKAEDLEPNMTGAMDDIHGHGDAISKQVEKAHKAGKKELPKEQKPATLPWMDKDGDKDGDGAASLLQMEACAPMPDLTETKSTECTTVMDVLRTAIKETVQGIIACLYAQQGAVAAPGPAPAMVNTLPTSSLPAAPAGVSGLVPLPLQPVAASFLHTRSPAPAFATAPGPAPGPATATAPNVKIFVTFSPGREMAGGRSTMVEISFLDRPANGLDDVGMAMPLVEQAIGSGLFHKQVKKALHKVAGIKPKLRGVEMVMKKIEQWAVNKCEEHIKGIVKQFTLHYTHNQVPRALYNECTNFMTKMSFSHDYVLDPMDTVRCKRATAKFAKHWENGATAQDSDFEGMCLQACEAKYGRNAPKCNIASGDGLLNQPL